MAEQAKGGLSGGQILGMVLVGGALGGGVLLYEWSQAKSKEYNNLLLAYQHCIQDLITYQSGNPTSEGLQAITDEQNQLLARMKALNTGWGQDIKNNAIDVAEAFGIVLIIPAVLIGGTIITLRYFIPWIIKEIFRNRPKGGGGGTYRCEKDGSTFTTPDALYAYEQQHFQPTTDMASIASAQAAFNGLNSWVQDTIAVTSGVYAGAYQDWRTLSGQQVMLLGWAFETMFAIGIITNPSVVLIAALLMI